MDFEKQSEMMDMKEEMMNDAIDDAMGDEDDEEETLVFFNLNIIFLLFFFLYFPNRPSALSINGRPVVSIFPITGRVPRENQAKNSAAAGIRTHEPCIK